MYIIRTAGADLDSLHLCSPATTEDGTPSIGNWFNTGISPYCNPLPDAGHVQLIADESWRDLPDVNEGDAGAAAAVEDGMRYSTESGHDDVTQGLPQVEALVAVLPATVNAMGVVRLTNQILEFNLEMWIYGMRVPLFHLWIGLP